MLRKTLTMIFVVGLIVTLFGCNTIHGFGEDLEWIGEGIQDISDQ